MAMYSINSGKFNFNMSNNGKNIPPIDKNLIDFNFPEIKRRTLPNGLTLLMISRSGLPKVSIRIGFNFGVKNDPPEKAGLTELIEAVIKKGTKNRTYSDIVEAVDMVGGELDAMVNRDFFFTYGEFLSEYLNTGLELMSDIILNPVFPKAELEKERMKLIANLENEKSSPNFLAKRRMNRALFNVHPYSKYKTVQSLQKIIQADLIDFHKKYFLPQNAVIVLAGNITESKALQLTEKYFREWKTRPAAPEKFEQPNVASKPMIYLVNRPDSEQSNILLGNLLFPRNNSKYEEMLVMNKILGGGGSGRLFMYLREEKGYTYGAYSTVQALKEAGGWFANAEVRNEVTADALRGFFELFKKIKTDLVEEDELANAKRYIMGVFPLQNETPASIAALALQQQLYNLADNYWDKYIKFVNKVDREAVRNAAIQFINEEQMIVVVVGDAKQLKDQLSEFGEVKIMDSEDQLVG